MDDRDKIQALWLNMEMIMNALEDLGENVRVSDTTDDYAVYGVSARVRWNHDPDLWEVTTP